MLQSEQSMRMARTTLAVVLLAALSCNRGSGDAPLQRADGSLLSSSGGEVSLSDGSKLSFVITSERYKQWDAAQRALDKKTAARFGVLLKPKAPTQQSTDQATAFLEGNAAAKAAIERTGMSVRDFVLVTVALEQEMQLARGQSGAPPTGMPPADMTPVDTTLPPTPVPVAPPQAIDTAPRRDTLPDTTTRRRDTLGPKPTRDTLRRPPPDTAHDTT